jgi:PAS domain S-box-containing protein
MLKRWLISGLSAEQDDRFQQAHPNAAERDRRLAVWNDRLLRFLTPQRLWPLPPVWRYGVVILIVVAATTLRWALIPWTGTTVPYNIALVAVVVTTVLLGLGPGLLSVLLADVAVEVFVLKSLPTMFYGATLLRLGTSVVIGVFVIWILHAIRAAAVKSRQSEARLTALVAATFEGVVESEAGRIVDCNKQFAQMFGRAIEELKGAAIIDLITPEDRERVAGNIGENRESVIEHAALRKDGTRIVVEAHGRPVAPNSPHRYTAIRDITERKRAEEALHENQARLEAVFAAMPYGIVEYDTSLRPARANPAAMKTAGFSSLDFTRDQAVAKLKFTKLDGNAVNHEDLPTSRALRGEMVADEEYVITNADGIERVISAYAVPLSKNGKIEGVVALWDDITQRKRAEAELERTRNTLAEAQKIAHLGSFEYVAATRTTVWSEEEYRIYGLDPAGPSPAYDVMLAKSIHPDDAALLHETFTKAMQSGSIYELEHRIVRPDGSVRWVYDRAQPYFDENRNLLRYVGATLDITARKQAEEALRKAHDELEKRVEERTAQLNQTTELAKAERRRFYDVLETLPAYVCLLTPDYRMPFANRIFREWFSYHPDKKCYEFLFNRSQPCEHCETYNVLKTSGPHRWEWTGPNGRDYDIFDFPFIDTDGSPLILEMGIDITERRQAEKALKELNETLEQRIAQRTAELHQSREDLDRAQIVGQIGWWRLDTRRNVLTWSDENHRIFGVPKGTPLTYEAFLAIVHPDDREYVDTQWNAGLRGEPYDIEHRIVADGKVKWVREKAYLEFDKKGALLGGFGITQDITQRRQAEEALREANEQLEGKVRERTAELVALNEDLMETRDQLRSLASDLVLTEAREKRALASELHDTVAQMLAIAKLTLEATGARLEGKSQEEVKKVVQLLQEASRQTRSLMADLSPALLYEAGLGQALRALARRMGELHSLAIEVVDDGSPKPLEENYRVLLFRAVQELLHNVVKHAKATKVKVSLQREGTEVRIEVKDDGVGFVASQRGRGDGMREGFGLFSIQERLQHLGGSFEIFSQPGRGVRAVLVVPLQVEAGGKGREPAAVRILIAEDHRMMRDALASLLKEWGFEVVGLAEDGVEAVRLAREVQPDVVLMDIQMPGMDGIEATRQITAELPEIKVIGLSVQTEPQIAANIVAAGACSFVPKSARPEELTEAIRTAVGSGKGN